MHKTTKGFTIVELLIVIVVIAILAAISIAAYNGIQNRANDTAVQNDLKGTAKQLELYKVDKEVYPYGNTQLATVGPRVTTTAYGNGLLSDTFNFLYCRVPADGPDKFALIASSKSGNVFTYRSDTGAITKAATWSHASSSVNLCQDAGVNQTEATDRDWFYQDPGSWKSYVNQ